MKTNYQNKTLYLLSAAMLAASPVAPVFAAATCEPKAQIAPDNRTVPELTSVTLNGQPSKDTTAYLWTQTAGTAVTLSAKDVDKPTFSAPGVGSGGETLTFKLTVTGCSPLKSDSITTNINVTDVNQNRPPVAAATISPVDIYEGTIVTLAGSASSDPDGNALTYKWEQIGTPSVTLTNPNTATATFTAPAAPYPGGISLKFKLTVSDGSLTGTTEVIVNVLWLNQSPVADVSCPSSVDEGANGTLDGSGSADLDDGIASYLWSQTLGGPIAILPANLTTQSISFMAPFLTSPLNTMSFKLKVTDNGKLADSAECDVIVNDITPPTAAPTPTPAANSAGWNNTDVDVNWNWTDAGMGVDDANCTQTGTSTSEGNPLTLSATCKDLADNEGSDSYDVNVDKTKPGITWNGDIDAGGVFYWGLVPTAPTCVATDSLSGPKSCAVTGYSDAKGSHILTATADDKAGNVTEETRGYTVEAWTLKGFYQPVDMGGVWNTVKGGSTVPLKFEVFAGTKLTDVAVVKAFTVTGATCPGASEPTAEIELTTTGGTSLRYDSVAGQFIQNWQTPKKPGACYKVTMMTNDGSSIFANFKLK